MLQAYIPNVSHVPCSELCYKCFYLDVAYVVAAIYICCKRIFQIFRFVAEVSSRAAHRRAEAHEQQHVSSRLRHAAAYEVLRGCV
jgi:hypothetical protein